MAIANLAMATGNIGREGVGVNPLRGQNNVQGSCDMGSFPHEVSGYRHVSEDATRAMFEALWGRPLDEEPGLRIPNMMDAAVDGSFKGLYIQGEDILQSDPNTQHMAAGLAAMECVVVQDLFLDRDRELRPRVPARLDLPGEERHLHQCRAPHPDGAQGDGAEERLRGLADHHAALQRARLSDALQPPSEIMDEIAALTPTFADVSYKKLDELGSVQWPCNEKAPEGTPIMHINGFVRGKGKFVITEYMATDERTGPRFPLLLTTGRILSQYNVGAQTRRTANVVWHEEDRAGDSSARRRAARRARRRLGEAREPRRRDDAARADHRARGAGRRLHHLPPPDTQVNVVTTEYSDWATNCPEYKVTAVQVMPSNGPSEWQEEYEELTRQSRRIAEPLVAAE